MSKKAIVLGGHVQGLGIVRALGKMGYDVSLIDQSRYNIGRHSRYCRSFIPLANRQIVPYLLSRKGLERHAGSVLFPTHDEQVEQLSRHREELSARYKPAVDNWEIVKYCFNKRKTYQAAQEAGVSIPETWFPDNREEVEELALEMDKPCIIKPAVMYTFFKSFNTKVFVCSNGKELLANYDRAIQVIPKDEIIVQNIIPGGSGLQYSVGCLYNRDHPVVTLAARRLRQHPPDFGNATTYAETVHQPEIVESAYKLLNCIGYRGICEVEFKKDPNDGEFKLLEINPRTWKWHSISVNAKTPFIENYVRILNGQTPAGCNTWGKASWSHYITDMPTVLQLKMKGLYTRPEKIRPMQAVVDTSDLKPALFELMYLPYTIRSRG